MNNVIVRDFCRIKKGSGLTEDEIEVMVNCYFAALRSMMCNELKECRVSHIGTFSHRHGGMVLDYFRKNRALFALDAGNDVDEIERRLVAANERKEKMREKRMEKMEERFGEDFDIDIYDDTNMKFRKISEGKARKRKKDSDMRKYKKRKERIANETE